MINLAHVDINCVTMCNNRCIACSHASPFTAPYYMEISTLERDLAAIKPFIHFNNIQLVGGEPLLHPEIVRLIKYAKYSGVSDSVVVITNGRLLPKMREEFWQKVPYLQISVYKNLDRSVLDLAKAKSKQYGFGLGITEFDSFYLQFKREQNDGVKEFNECTWKTSCYTIHEGHFFLCPQSAFFPRLFQGLYWNIDGLPLYGLTESQLDDFLNRKTPFNACRICTGGRRSSTPWKEARNKYEWMEESTE